MDESVIPLESWAPDGERLIVARRAAAELKPGDICNVGIGMPVGTAYVAVKEGIHDMFHMTVECGSIGGITGGGFFFGTAFNARAFLQHHEMFDFYNGHGLDIAFLGAAEVGEDGSVNVTRIAGRTHGSGGFVNISGCTKKLVFMTSLTGGGKCLYEDGVLKIVKEGKPVKFVKKVDQVSFNGREAVRKGQDVTYLTERAVFKLIDGKLTLVEAAPGLDVEKDILALMNFRPEISPDLKPMPAFCFTKEPIGLKAQWEKILAFHSAKPSATRYPCPRRSMHKRQDRLLGRSCRLGLNHRIIPDREYTVENAITSALPRPNRPKTIPRYGAPQRRRRLRILRGFIVITKIVCGLICAVRVVRHRLQLIPRVGEQGLQFIVQKSQLSFYARAAKLLA